MGEPAPALVPWLENQSVLSGYFGLHLGLQRFKKKLLLLLFSWIIGWLAT
jgi:hypothetical protein